jgi:hypothetical protein
MPNLGTNTAGKALIVATSRLIHHQLMKLPSIKQHSSMLSQSHSLRIYVEKTLWGSCKSSPAGGSLDLHEQVGLWFCVIWVSRVVIGAVTQR